MRRTALLFVIAVCGYAANAQFTIKPQAGFEVPSTKLSYNDGSYFKPQSLSSMQWGLRADYRFKGGFGPFVGFVTHRPMVSYHFNDPMTGMSSYDATKGDMMLQLQGGLQYTSKAISLNKKSSSKASNTSKKENHCYSSCGRKYSQERSAASQKDMWTMRLQPSAGIGYVPSDKQDMSTLISPGYTYNAGNVSAEFIGGMGFEFARNTKKFITLNVNYFTGLEKNETGFTTKLAGGKEEHTVLRSKVSGWSASIGIPISFAKKPAVKRSASKSQKKHGGCNSYYRSRCGF